MKKFLCLIATALFAVPVLAQDVGVSIPLGDSGFYGRIDLGDAPRPRILYRDPIVVDRVVVQAAPPIYMRVPPGHARKWSKHCGKYNACGQPVYFVHNDWYNNVYTPYYRERSGRQDRDDNHGSDRHDRDNDDDRGGGHGKGKGKGNKH